MKTFLVKCLKFHFVWYFAIVINIFILFYFFLLPRASFLLEHPGYSYKDIRMSTSTSDNKNINAMAFKLAYEIKDLIPENSTILYEGTNLSLNHVNKIDVSNTLNVMTQILFPREVRSERDFQFTSRDQFLNEIFFLTKKKSNKYCNANNSKSIKILNDGWYLCHESIKF